MFTASAATDGMETASTSSLHERPLRPVHVVARPWCGGPAPTAGAASARPAARKAAGGHAPAHWGRSSLHTRSSASSSPNSRRQRQIHVELVDAVGSGDRQRAAVVERHSDERRSADHAAGPRGSEQEQAGVPGEPLRDEAAVPVVESDPLGPAEAGMHPAGSSVGAEFDDLVAGRQRGTGDEEVAVRVERQVIGRNRRPEVREHADVAVGVDPVEGPVPVADHQISGRREPDARRAAEILGEHVEHPVVTHPVHASVLARGHVEGVVRTPREAGRVHDAVTHRFGVPVVGQSIDRMGNLLAAPAADRRVEVAAGVVHGIRDDVEILGEEAADGHGIRLGFPVVQAHPHFVAGAVGHPDPQPGGRDPVQVRLFIPEEHPQTRSLVHRETAASNIQPAPRNGVVRPDPLDGEPGTLRPLGAPHGGTSTGGHRNADQISSVGAPAPAGIARAAERRRTTDERHDVRQRSAGLRPASPAQRKGGQGRSPTGIARTGDKRRRTTCGSGAPVSDRHRPRFSGRRSVRACIRRATLRDECFSAAARREAGRWCAVFPRRSEGRIGRLSGAT